MILLYSRVGFSLEQCQFSSSNSSVKVLWETTTTNRVSKLKAGKINKLISAVLCIDKNQFMTVKNGKPLL